MLLANGRQLQPDALRTASFLSASAGSVDIVRLIAISNELMSSMCSSKRAVTTRATREAATRSFT